MKTLYIKNLIAAIFLVLAFIACNKEDEKNDCNNIVIKDGKLLSPKWMVNFMDSLENTTEWVVLSGGKEISINIPKTDLTYFVESFEYQQQTYICMYEILYGNFRTIYTCSGDKYSSSNLLSLKEWSDAYNATRQGLFRILFCNHNDKCWAKRIIIEHYDRDVEHAVEDNSIYDCRNDFVFHEGKLLSPHWMVNVLKNLENKAVELNENARYFARYQEVRKQRYVYINKMFDDYSNIFLRPPVVIFTCSGVEVKKDSELYGGGFVSWTGTNFKDIFMANFWYAPEREEKKSEIIPYEPY